MTMSTVYAARSPGSTLGRLPISISVHFTQKAPKPSHTRLSSNSVGRHPITSLSPAAGGSLITKVGKALKEFHTLGLIDKPQTCIHVAQAEGCGPIATTVKEGSDFVKPVKPDTIAKSLAIGNPADGIYAADTVRNSGGYGEHASDDEIVEAIKLLAATEGIFTETAGGVTLAAAKKLIESGRISRDERIVVSITGNGLKTYRSP